MSVKMMGLVWDADLDRELKFVLLAYADHADHDGGSIWPAVATIAWKTGYTDRQVIRLTKRLREMGILVPEGLSAKRTNVYRIDLDALPIRDRPVRKQARRVEGDKMSPTTDGGEGDIPAIMDDISTLEGDIAVSDDPSLDPSLDPSCAAMPLAPKEKPKAQPAKGNGKAAFAIMPVAVAQFRAVTRRTPRHELWDDIARTVGDKAADLDFWTRVITRWNGCGWNPMNVDGMLECFRKRQLPSTAPGNGKGNGRGTPAPSPDDEMTPAERRTLARMEAGEMPDWMR